MKKQYIVPTLEIEEYEMAQSLMLTVSNIGLGEPFTEGESGTADAPFINDDVFDF